MNRAGVVSSGAVLLRNERQYCPAIFTHSASLSQDTTFAVRPSGVRTAPGRQLTNTIEPRADTTIDRFDIVVPRQVPFRRASFHACGRCANASRHRSPKPLKSFSAAAKR